MLFDTDILIWVERGNEKAADVIDAADERYISIQTYMELLQTAQDRRQHMIVKKFISEAGFVILPLTEDIGHRASIYVEEYTLSCSIRAGDAIIAATAIENSMPLVSSNQKHFRIINDLDLRIFNP